MRGGGLDTSSSGRDKSLDGRGIKASCELFLLRLYTRNYRNGQEILVHPSVQVKDLSHFGIGFLFGEMCGMAFLPQKFTCTNERLGVLELPSYNAIPLIQFERKISMTFDPFSVVWIHGSFRGGTDGDGLLQIGVSTVYELNDIQDKSDGTTYALVTHATSGEKPSM